MPEEDEVARAWSDYKATFGKEYADEADEQRHFEAFQSSHAFVLGHGDTTDPSFGVSLNHFSDWTDEELEALFGAKNATGLDGGQWSTSDWSLEDQTSAQQGGEEFPLEGFGMRYAAAPASDSTCPRRSLHRPLTIPFSVPTRAVAACRNPWTGAPAPTPPARRSSPR